MRNKSFYLGLISTSLLLCGCAQIVAPTGGKKDSTPPELIGVNPDNKTTNFNKTKITLTFNENIQVTKAEEQIIISPPVDRKPDIIAQGKQLTVKFYEALQPNTTYTINFGNAVGDNTENNTIANLSYVFSTGNLIDSNTIKGSVYNAFTNKPESGVTVGLYEVDGFTDSTIIKQKPIYLSKTNTAGLFELSNLPHQSYKLVAFNDVNQNLRYDRQELIAFENQFVLSADTNLFVKIPLFKPELYTLGRIIDTFCNEPNKFTLIAYKPENVVITPNTGNSYIKHVLGNDGIDTFYAFIPKPDAAMGFKVSINGIKHEFSIPHQPKFKAQKLSFTYTKQPELGDTITLKFNNPVTSIDKSRIKLTKDSMPVTYILTQPDAFTVKIYHNWMEKTSYNLAIADSSFNDMYGQWSKKEGSKFTTKSLKDYANMLLHVKTNTTKPYIIQLLSSDEKTVVYSYSINKSTDITITNMLPGTYVVKYIVDANRNGIWDNGDFTKKQQPEKVGYYSQPITVRAYWDLEQSILIE